LRLQLRLGLANHPTFASDHTVVEGVRFPNVAYYRAMHYSAKRGLALACRLSVCLSVTLVGQDQIG